MHTVKMSYDSYIFYYILILSPHPYVSPYKYLIIFINPFCGLHPCQYWPASCSSPSSPLLCQLAPLYRFPCGIQPRKMKTVLKDGIGLLRNSHLGQKILRDPEHSKTLHESLLWPASMSALGSVLLFAFVTASVSPGTSAEQVLWQLIICLLCWESLENQKQF